MNYEKVFSHSVTAILLELAGYYQSAAFAYTTVASLAVQLVSEAYSRLLASKEVKDVKPALPEEARRAIQDMNARIATLEYGVKQRGF